LRQGGAVRGAVALVVGPNFVGSRIAYLQWSRLVQSALLLLAMGLCVVWFFNRTVRSPIRRLSNAMARATGGDFSPIKEAQGGEFGFLAEAYNRMAGRLGQSVAAHQALLDRTRDFNEQLQREIQTATKALSDKNDQLQGANEKLFLIQRQMMLLEKLATLGQVSSSIAHEIGTPLNAIACHLHLFLENPGTDPAQMENIRIAEEQIGRLSEIVRNILHTMRLPPPRLARTDLNDLVGSVTSLLVPLFQKRRIHVDLQLDRQLPPVQADANQMEQVLINLMTNAVDAMPGGGTLKVATSYHRAIGAAAPGEGGKSPAVCFTVSDTGDGMDDETLRRLFNPFFTTKSGAAAESAGFGLGMPICLQIVKGHNGEITATSQKGRGTSFTIEIPLDGPSTLSAS
jgi:signal transduction histidine kinase